MLGVIQQQEPLVAPHVQLLIALGHIVIFGHHELILLGSGTHFRAPHKDFFSSFLACFDVEGGHGDGGGSSSSLES